MFGITVIFVTSKYILWAAFGLMSAYFPPVPFDNRLHPSCHQFWPSAPFEPTPATHLRIYHQELLSMFDKVIKNNNNTMLLCGITEWNWNCCKLKNKTSTDMKSIDIVSHWGVIDFIERPLIDFCILCFQKGFFWLIWKPNQSTWKQHGHYLKGKISESISSSVHAKEHINLSGFGSINV